ncbi:SDR family oxidoreductase [soil metagenome]
MSGHALVTGAASGIGLDCCRDLLERGFTVFALDRSGEALERAKGTLAHADRYIGIPCDVSLSSAVTAAFEQVRRQTPKLDVLICSAGVFCAGRVLEVSEADFDRTFAVNTKGAWLTAKAALPLLEAAAGPTHPARVVFVASLAALRPKVNGGVYAATKAALGHLTRVMAVELAPRNILVNAVAPATVDTPFTQALTAGTGGSYKLSGTSPLGRVAQPSDVTAVVRFLLSDAANYLAGVILPIDGGTSAAFDPG